MVIHLILLLTLTLHLSHSQPFYYLNQIYSDPKTEVIQITLTPDKNTLIVLPVVGGFFAYNRSETGNYTFV